MFLRVILVGSFYPEMLSIAQPVSGGLAINVNISVNEIAYLYRPIAPIVKGRIWGAGVWVTRRDRQKQKKMRFKTGLESSKTVRWADMQMKRVPFLGEDTYKKPKRQKNT